MRITVLDTETTGLNGYPNDVVVQIGAATLDIDTMIVEKRFEYLIAHEPEFLPKDAWVFQNTTITRDSVIDAEANEAEMGIYLNVELMDEKLTSYNVPFDFYKFLCFKPFNLYPYYPAPRKHLDIMDLATAACYDVCQDNNQIDNIPTDEGHYTALRVQDEFSYRPDKWVRSYDAYRILCYDDPAGLRKTGQTHTALKDAEMEAYILAEVIERYPEVRKLFDE